MGSVEADRAPSVFISYRRDDEPWLTQVVADECRAAFGSQRVFLDMSSLAPGVTVSEEISAALSGVSVVIAIIGPAWGGAPGDYSRLFAGDDWVRRELAGALQAGVSVIPVLAGATTMPRAADLPPEITDLADLNAIPVTPTNRDEDIRDLVIAIWERWAAGHDVVMLADDQHEVLMGEFITQLQRFAKDDVVYASRLASGVGVLDFRDEGRRPVLIALLPDAEEWDEVNERIQRLLRSHRFDRLLLVGTGTSSGYLFWDKLGKHLAGSAADSVSSMASAEGVDVQLVDVSNVISDGHIAGDPAAIGEAMSTLVNWIPAAAAAAPPAALAVAEVGLGPVRRIVGWFVQGLADKSASTIVATAAGSAAAVGGVLVVREVVVPEPDPPIASLKIVTDFQTFEQPATTEIYLMNADGSNLEQLTNNGFWDSQPDLFADRRITFASDRDGNREIYAMNADGSEPVRLTFDDASDFCPTWSPDGERIAFTSERDGNQEVYVMNADGSAQTRVTENDAHEQCPKWSPDGDALAFTGGRDGNWNVYTIGTDGTGERQITSDPSVDQSPDWSPDGGSIVFQSDRDGDLDIYVVDVEEGTETRIVDDPSSDYKPLWTPDGSKILFASRRGLGEQAGEYYVTNPDGTEQTRLTSFNDCQAVNTSTCVRE